MATLRIIIATTVTLFLTSSAYAQTFTKHDFYSINATGWQRNTTPSGDVFTCSTCGAQVQVQIDYGPPLSPDAPFRINEQFLASFNTQAKQKDFADRLLRRSIPLRSGFKISIEQVGLTKIGGIEVIQFSAVVDFGSSVTRDTTMVAIHKNRILKITLNYYDGAMNDRTRRAVNSLFESLKFF